MKYSIEFGDEAGTDLQEIMIGIKSKELALIGSLSKISNWQLIRLQKIPRSTEPEIQDLSTWVVFLT